MPLNHYYSALSKLIFRLRNSFLPGDFGLSEHFSVFPFGYPADFLKLVVVDDIFLSGSEVFLYQYSPLLSLQVGKDGSTLPKESVSPPYALVKMKFASHVRFVHVRLRHDIMFLCYS